MISFPSIHSRNGRELVSMDCGQTTVVGPWIAGNRHRLYRLRSSPHFYFPIKFMYVYAIAADDSTLIFVQLV